jgi:hypothetical protein
MLEKTHPLYSFLIPAFRLVSDLKVVRQRTVFAVFIFWTETGNWAVS